MEKIISLLFSIYDKVFFYFNSSQWNLLIFYLKITSTIFSIIFALLIILVSFKFFSLKNPDRKLLKLIFKKQSIITKEKINKKWLEVLKHMQSKNYNMAIIESDKILEEIFKKMGLKGKTMAEFLAQINKEQISTIKELREVHKIRNQIVHNIDFQISESTANKIMEIYQKTFKELEFIE